VLSVSFLVTILSASRAFWVVVHAIAIAYDLEEAQPTWLSRLLGLAFTVAGLVVGLVLIPVVVAGPRLGEIIESRLGVQLLLAQTWRLAYWPVSLVVVMLLLALLYHYATQWSTPFRRDLPGAALATVLALLASVGLRFYTSAAFGGEGVYAPLAAPLAILVFLWLQALALLLGAELNAEIEKASPTGAVAPDAPSLAAIGRRALDGAKGFRQG
jgi:membrane protein